MSLDTGEASTAFPSVPGISSWCPIQAQTTPSRPGDALKEQGGGGPRLKSLQVQAPRTRSSSPSPRRGVSLEKKDGSEKGRGERDEGCHRSRRGERAGGGEKEGTLPVRSARASLCLLLRNRPLPLCGLCCCCFAWAAWAAAAAAAAAAAGEGGGGSGVAAPSSWHFGASILASRVPGPKTGKADGVDSEDSSEPPPHKRLCVSSEDDESVEGNPPCISVVALPISESDQSFEVTMTATTEVADHEVNEGTVTQIQILQNEQLDEISSLANEEVSAVSQAWFTTKEDKDCLTNKGKFAFSVCGGISGPSTGGRPVSHKWKQGMWSKEEIQILMSNIERYLKARGIKDATEIIFEMSKDERKDFYRTIAWGLNRPLFAVYRRVLRMYDDRNHVGKYTPEEIEKLKELRIKHGNDWATIGAALGRSASSVKDRCRLMKDTCNTGKWTEKEEKRLAEVVHELTSTEPGDIVTQGVSWAAVAERVGTRSEKQCRSKWLNYLNWKQSGGTEWTKEDEINLILSNPEYLFLPVLIKGLRQLHESQKNAPTHQLPDAKSLPGLPNSHPGSGVQHVQIRVARLEESSVCSPASVAALQIPLQITHVSSADSPAASVDSETITLNSGTLQTFEILPSFHLQPTGTPGTYLLQTSSSQGLPLTLTASPTVTLTAAAAPASPDQIIVHALSVRK
ncbi:hypothetical protein E2320_005773 [Naja naja]|nr:hypothetical protein E2320_005773 [Naja naja]